MNQAYNITLSDGTYRRFECSSSAEAIGQALRENLGRKVTRCWAGGVVDPKMPSAYGIVEFDVPPHEPMTVKEKLSYRRTPNGPAVLFNDETILNESARAKAKAANAEPR